MGAKKVEIREALISGWWRMGRQREVEREIGGRSGDLVQKT